MPMWFTFARNYEWFNQQDFGKEDHVVLNFEDCIFVDGEAITLLTTLSDCFASRGHKFEVINLSLQLKLLMT